MRYLSHTQADRQEMLDAIGVESVDALFSPIPEALRATDLDLPAGLSELETRQHLEALAGQNRIYGGASFLGAGCYNHFVPAAVRSLTARAEFATAYTPYQAEVAQGTLQHIFEFQTALCELTGLGAANASMYDGPSALAEAAFLALRHNHRDRILASAGLHPEERQVVETYASGPGFQVSTLELDEASGQTRLPTASELEGVGALLVRQPNFYGVIEDLRPLAAAAHEAGALLVVSQYPVTLGLLAPPAQVGADVAVGDVQPFGNARAFGGPSAGYLVCRQDLVRQLPGRLVGQTIDADGRTAYALTLQAREQHIRRSRATSNICSNQALNALAATIHLALLGPRGLAELGEICVRRAHYLLAELLEIPGIEAVFAGPFFNEFALRLPLPAAEFTRAMRARGVDPGVELARFSGGDGHGGGDQILVAVTEMNSPEEIGRYLTAARAVLAGEEAPDA